jgi:hypothetical protein
LSFVSRHLCRQQNDLWIPAKRISIPRGSRNLHSKNGGAVQVRQQDRHRHKEYQRADNPGQALKRLHARVADLDMYWAGTDEIAGSCICESFVITAESQTGSSSRSYGRHRTKLPVQLSPAKDRVRIHRVLSRDHCKGSARPQRLFRDLPRFYLRLHAPHAAFFIYFISDFVAAMVVISIGPRLVPFPEIGPSQSASKDGDNGTFTRCYKARCVVFEGPVPDSASRSKERSLLVQFLRHSNISTTLERHS